MRSFNRLLATLCLVTSACGSSSDEVENGGTGGTSAGGRGGTSAGGQSGGGSGGDEQPGPDSGAAGSPAGGSGGQGPVLSDAGPPPDETIVGTPTFVAAGYGGLRGVSRDLGRTWVDMVEETAQGGDDPTLLRGLGCGAGLCIAGGGSSGTTGRLLVTSNGRTWTPISTNAPGISDVAYGRKLWVAVSGNYAVRSTDAKSWPKSDNHMLEDNKILRRMRFVGARFIAWGDKGKCVVSDDGALWTPCVRDTEWNDIAYGNGVYVAVGTKRMTSTDGVTWQTAEAASGDWVVWTGTQFVAGGNRKTQMSSDGHTWTERASPTMPQPDASVAYGAGTFVANWAWSNDGVTWTKVTPLKTSNGVTKIAFGGLAGQ